MRRTTRSSLTVIAILTLLLTLGVGWGLVSALAESASPPATTAPGGEKIILQTGYYEKIDSLNPFIGWAGVAYDVYNLNYDLLVDYDPDTLQPIPGLAESWETSEDGKTWTFHLRKDATWQDGLPLTANDVAFTYNYNVDNELAQYAVYTENVKHTTALDDYTVQIECTKPKPGVLQMWIPIIPEHIWSKISPKDAESDFQNLPPCVGSGPFQVVEWKKSEYVRLEANKAYWGGAPQVDELIFRFYTTEDTMVSDLKSGAIQYAEVPQAQYTALQGNPELTTGKAQLDTFDELGFNCYEGPSKGHPVLKDPAFRKALNWAVDRESIANIAFGGAATPATGFLPASFWSEPLDYHWEPPADAKYTFDLERANQELDAAGYTDSDGNGIREYKGEDIKLRLWAVNDRAQATRMGKLITGNLKQVGLEIELQTIDSGAASEGMYAYEGDVFTPDYDMYIWFWTGDFDPGFLLSVFTTDQIENWSDCNWSNPEYDALFKQQDSELEPATRKDIIWQMQEIIYDQTPNLVLIYAQTLEAYDTAKWEGWVHQPAGSGSVNNTWTYQQVHPVTATAASDEGGGSNTGLIVALVAGGIVIVALVIWFASRGRKAAEEE